LQFLLKRLLRAGCNVEIASIDCTQRVHLQRRTANKYRCLNPPAFIASRPLRRTFDHGVQTWSNKGLEPDRLSKNGVASFLNRVFTPRSSLALQKFLCIR
jgi:hypothetical protein